MDVKYGISAIKKDENDEITHVRVHKCQDGKYGSEAICTIAQISMVIEVNICYTILKIRGNWERGSLVFIDGANLRALCSAEAPDSICNLPKIN